MKFVKSLFVLLALVFNMVVAQPAWADRPDPKTNPDYVAITEELSTLLQDTADQTPTVEKVQRIADLRFQKYVIETGEKVAICRNETGGPIAVYGQPGKKVQTTFENVLYLLPDGEETDDSWSCNGIYVPATADASAKAVKVVNGTYLVASTNPDTQALELNVPLIDVFQIGDAAWDVPETLDENSVATLPNAPTD